MADNVEIQAPFFRARKRRRVEYRRRDEVGETEEFKVEDASPAAALSPDALDGNASTPELGDSSKLHELLKRRKFQKSRRLGLTTSSHTAAANPQDDTESQALALVKTQPDIEQIEPSAMAKRFVKQTGRAVNELEEKHEDDFIDRRLAELNGTRANPSTVDQASNRHTQQSADPAFATSSLHLEEVDAASLPRRKPPNITAHRPLNKNRKARRGPPSPTAGNVARQRALEAVLADASLDYYSKPSDERVREKGMDEVLAQEFEQEYKEQQEQRRQRQPPSMPGDKTKGPKLGGSRSQRAAHHEKGKKGGGGVMPT